MGRGCPPWCNGVYRSGSRPNASRNRPTSAHPLRILAKQCPLHRPNQRFPRRRLRLLFGVVVIVHHAAQGADGQGLIETGYNAEVEQTFLDRAAFVVFNHRFERTGRLGNVVIVQRIEQAEQLTIVRSGPAQPLPEKDLAAGPVFGPGMADNARGNAPHLGQRGQEVQALLQPRLFLGQVEVLLRHDIEHFPFDVVVGAVLVGDAFVGRPEQIVIVVVNRNRLGLLFVGDAEGIEAGDLPVFFGIGLEMVEESSHEIDGCGRDLAFLTGAGPGAHAHEPAQGQAVKRVIAVHEIDLLRLTEPGHEQTERSVKVLLAQQRFDDESERLGRTEAFEMLFPESEVRVAALPPACQGLGDVLRRFHRLRAIDVRHIADRQRPETDPTTPPGAASSRAILAAI